MKSFFISLGIGLLFCCGFLYAAQSDKATYVPDSQCKKCHMKEWKVWGHTGMSKALDSLKGDEQKNPECLKCHTTGAGKEGGFKDVASTPDLANVGCQSCHGAGSEHMAVPMSDKEKRRATINVPKNECTQCHGGHKIHTKGADGKHKIISIENPD